MQVHEDQSKREKLQCIFCGKEFFHTASIKKHARGSHPLEFSEYKRNRSFQLYQKILFDNRDGSPPNREEQFPISLSESSFNGSPAEHKLDINLSKSEGLNCNPTSTQSTGTPSSSDACGHLKVLHNGHIDYLDNGELHHVSEKGNELHRLERSERNPSSGPPIPIYPVINGIGYSLNPNLVPRQDPYDLFDYSDEIAHIHSEFCGHPQIIHDDHIDYIVNGRLHHPHEYHCDDHGEVDIIENL